MASPNKKFSPKVIGKVTVPQLKIKTDTPLYVKFEDKIETRVDMANAKKDESTGETIPGEIRIARIIDLTTGELREMIIGTVLDKILNEHYPNNGYVGHGFGITQRNVEGKRYKQYEVDEIEV